MGELENLDFRGFWIFWDPWEPLFMDLDIPNYKISAESQILVGNHLLNNVESGNLKILSFWNLGILFETSKNLNT